MKVGNVILPADNPTWDDWLVLAREWCTIRGIMWQAGNDRCLATLLQEAWGEGVLAAALSRDVSKGV